MPRIHFWKKKGVYSEDAKILNYWFILDFWSEHNSHSYSCITPEFWWLIIILKCVWSKFWLEMWNLYTTRPDLDPCHLLLWNNIYFICSSLQKPKSYRSWKIAAKSWIQFFIKFFTEKLWHFLKFHLNASCLNPSIVRITYCRGEPVSYPGELGAQGDPSQGTISHYGQLGDVNSAYNARPWTEGGNPPKDKKNRKRQYSNSQPRRREANVQATVPPLANCLNVFLIFSV